MSGIMKYFGNAARYGPAVNLFEKLIMKDGEMASLLAKSYLGMGRFTYSSKAFCVKDTAKSFSCNIIIDEEVKAVQVLYRAVQEHPQSYPLLQVQSDLLRNKVRFFPCLYGLCVCRRKR